MGIVEINSESWKEFDYSKYKEINPPENTSTEVYDELKHLLHLPEDKVFVKKHDDIEKVFEQVCEENNIEYPKELVVGLIKSTKYIILDLKLHHNRPRPYQLASEYNINLGEEATKCIENRSYPSGHSCLGFLIGNVLQRKLENNTDVFLKAGKRISHSRNLCRRHYISDSIIGEEIGNSMYEYIKDKI